VKPLSSFEGSVEGLFFDLDDTFLSHGVLTRDAYDALWSLHDAGIRLVAVTGRPSGWAEVLVRQWPIDGAVTENGAVHVVRDGRGIRVLAPAGLPERSTLLDALVTNVRKEMPHVPLADDNHHRRSDRAWDIGERATLPADEVEALAAIVRAAGARTTRSTVHLHASFEVDDKASGAVRFASERFGVDAGRVLTTWGFVGDSPNDGACFAAFRTTFGVANVRRYVQRLSVPPRFVTLAERGAGFAELATTLVHDRGRNTPGSSGDPALQPVHPR
jgi:hydroxymethylpyrimidine pyrophosphatase-like HAD family hydrolase